MKCPACQERNGRHTRAECIEYHPQRNPDCPACLDSLRHPPEMYREFHQEAPARG